MFFNDPLPRPKPNKTYFGLSTADRGLYMAGVPLDILQAGAVEESILFGNEKISAGVLTTAYQTKYYTQILEAHPENIVGPGIWASHPNDFQAQRAVLKVIKKFDELHKFRSVRYIHPSLPYLAELQENLVILQGVSDKDPEIVHHVRRWLRNPFGIQCWVILTSPNPFKWCQEELGIIPNLLFKIQAGKTAG